MKFTQSINLKTRYILFSETLQIRKGSHRFQQIMWNQAYIHIFTLYLVLDLKEIIQLSQSIFTFINAGKNWYNRMTFLAKLTGSKLMLY